MSVTSLLSGAGALAGRDLLAQGADLTALAVKAGTLRRGADGTQQGRGREQAVVISPEFAKIAEAAARFQGTTRDAAAGSSGAGDSGGRLPAGEGLRIIAEATAKNVVEMTLSIGRMREALRIYDETGELWSVQVTGRYKVDPSVVGGAEAYIADIQERLDRRVAYLPRAQENAKVAQASYKNHMEYLRSR